MRTFLDGLASFIAALATIAICGLPSYFTYQAIQASVAPTWAWGAIIALSAVGIIMTVAFLSKAAKGVAPSRERRRR